MALTLIVAVTICSWIATANHCAITAIAKTETTQSSCPYHSKPTRPSPKSSATECCKSLRAVPTTPTKELAPAIHDLFPVNSVSYQLAIIEPREFSIAPGTLDTGPPGKTSFAELNRSLRPHAPPLQD